jgi:hypothetical protein
MCSVVDRGNGWPSAISIAWYLSRSIAWLPSGCTEDSPARDRYPLASRWSEHIGAGNHDGTAAGRSSRRDSTAHARDEIANPLWRAPRIHGELLKLGIDVGQNTVAKYMGEDGHRRKASLVIVPTCRINRHVRGPHDFISTVVWTSVLRHSRRELYGWV